MADKLEDLRTYIAIVDHGGVNAAAAAMGIARSAVSRRLSDLEARIGVTLIERTTRRFEPTGVGRAYLARAREILASVDELDGAFIGAFDGSPVTISSEDSAALEAILPALATFLSVNEGFEVALTIGADARSEVLLTIGADGPAVGATRCVVCASPTYLARRPAPASATDLARHVAISTPGDAGAWRRATGEPRPQVVLALPNLSLVLSAAQLGVGLALLPEASITAHVGRGELIVILEQTCPPPEPIHAAAAPKAGGAALMLVDFLNAWSRSAD